MPYDNAEALAARYGAAYRWWVTIAGMVGVLAMVLSMTTVNVAVPDVMGAFGIGQDTAQWMSSAYTSSMTVGMVLNAWVVGVLGERRTFITALAVFSCGAVTGGTAPNEDVLILARVLQGFSSGVAQPLVMAIIFAVFPADRRGMAMGVFGLGVVFAPAIGPTLGGLMIEFFNWRYVFFIALPFCLAAAILGALFMPTQPWPRSLPRFDWTGFILMCVGLLGLMTGFANGQREGWDSGAIVLRLAVGAAATVAFIAWDLRVEKPLLDVRMFADRQFASAAIVAFIFGACMLGSTYLVPVFVQTTQGFTPLVSGLMMMPAGLMLAVIFPVAGRLSDATPPALMIMGGLLTFAAGFVALAGADVDTTFWTLAVVTLVSRLGLGFINPSLNASSLKALPPERLRQGAGAVNFVRQLGGAFGTILFVAFLENRARFHAEALTATQSFSNHTSDLLIAKVESLLLAAGLSANVRHGVALEHLGAMLQAQSQTMAFQDTFLLVAGTTLVALVPAYLLSRSQRRSTPVAPVRMAAAAD
ncbi:MAG: DHA2 family efflux MFS transporter permease subunit [Rhodospirillales bacterium]|nr:MAG: DHA2 family efflux MFS transporter permease subunit [Rhodospirillales bacterium]